MHLLFSLVLLLSWTQDALTTPAAHQSEQQTRSFKVERIKRSHYVANGPIALHKALRKFGITPVNPTGVDVEDFELYNSSTQNSLTRHQSLQHVDQEGSVNATSVQCDLEFVSPVTIGGQNITMDFDTGSSDMWVMNTLMQSPMPQGHTLYDPQKSSTYMPIRNGEFEISYGDSSSVRGALASDTVFIGGVTVQQQTFGLAMEVSNQLMDDIYSNGIVGLGFGVMNTFIPGPQKTFFENLAPMLDEPVLTAKLRSDGVGEYEFGTIDHSKYSGPLVNISVDSADGYWQVDTPVYGVQIGNTNRTWESPNATAIVDTGSSLILAHPDLVDLYYKQVPGATQKSSFGQYTFPCDAELPDLFIMFGYECKVFVPGWALNYQTFTPHLNANEQMCYGGLQSNHGADFQILGDVFLKAYFVVFDHRGPSLGLAHPT